MRNIFNQAFVPILTQKCVPEPIIARVEQEC